MEMKWQDFDLAEFLRPRPEKIAAMVTLLIITTPLFINTVCAGTENISHCVDQAGFPMPLYGMFKESDLLVGKDANNYFKLFVIGFLADLVFWYVVSCLLIFAYGRFTGKGKLGEIG